MSEEGMTRDGTVRNCLGLEASQGARLSEIGAKR